MCQSKALIDHKVSELPGETEIFSLRLINLHTKAFTFTKKMSRFRAVKESFRSYVPDSKWKAATQCSLRLGKAKFNQDCIPAHVGQNRLPDVIPAGGGYLAPKMGEKS